MFAVYLNPEQRKRVVAVFAQDMGKADWNRPEGHWIDAKGALYVLAAPVTVRWARPSRPLAVRRTAGFVKKHGGNVLRFESVTLNMVALDGGVVRDEHEKR